ncbi:MAG: EAL domain-containing protein [Gemmatimonadota bacterium]|nr:EAL domain-containing protein [Gemmatimonadota bacterium]
MPLLANPFQIAQSSLAARRASVTNRSRLLICCSYACACVGLQLMGYELSPWANALFVVWLLLILTYSFCLHRARTAEAADRVQALGFYGDLSLLPGMYLVLGGGWWLGAATHGLIVTFAFASLPRRRAWYITAYAILTFVGLLGLEAQGIVMETPFLGAPLIGGNQRFAAVLALFGALSIVASAVIQNTFIGIMRRAQERYRTLLRSAPDMILTTDPRGVVTSANLASGEQSGRAPEELVGLPLESVVHTDDRGMLAEHIDAAILGEAREFEVRFVAQDASMRIVNCTCSAIREDGRVTGLLLIGRDMTERKRAEEEMLHDSLHDRLTGLPNRAYLLQRLEFAIALAARRPEAQFAILYVDLDRFKWVNDSFGHPTGDQLLIAVAQRLKLCLRPSDMVARIGGDEFAIILEHITSNDAARTAARIQQQLATPIDLNGYEVFSSASIGIALSTHPPEPAEYLLRSADMAMYRAKKMGASRYALFDREMHSQALERLQLETDLRRALERDEFHLVWQPLVALNTGQIIGLEALIRWDHPTQGLLNPAQFIPITEELGLIVPIGRWVLVRTCRQLREWQLRFPRPVPLTASVNVSVKQFNQPDFVEQVIMAVEEAGIDPRTLQLEITEGVVFDRADAAIETLTRLRKIGVEVHLDDFGQGYSSLSYLNRLPIDAIKIDRAFVGTMSTEHASRQVVHTILRLAQGLGVRSVAEGVETPEQLEELRHHGCDLGQGYYFSRPVKSDAVERLLGCGPAWMTQPLASAKG